MHKKGEAFTKEEYFAGNAPKRRTLRIPQRELSKMTIADLQLALAMADDCVIGTGNDWGGYIKALSSELLRKTRDAARGK